VRAALGRNVVANLLSAASGIAASLVSLPIVLDAVGPAGYGVWTIGLAIIAWFSVADTGFAPAVQRWTAWAKGEDRPEDVVALLWTTLLAYIALGVVMLGAALLLAEPATRLFDFPAALRADAVRTLELVGLVLLVTMVGAALGNVLQGLERFVAMGVTTALGAIAFLASVVVLLEAGRGIVGLAEAAIVQQGTIALTRACAVRRLVTGHRPRLVGRAQVREMAVFSAKLQVSVLAWLFNSQSDKVVMGLVASTATVGQLGIASQVADAGRLVAGAALAPIVASLAVTAALRDPERLRVHFAWVHRTWLEVIGGGTVIGLAVLHPLLLAWLGRGYGEASVFGAFLVAGMGGALLTGTAVAYLRAIGRPGLEARYGVVMVVLNIAFTVPLALVLGPVGVVAGTLLAYVLAALWLLRRFAAEAPETVRPRPADLLRPLGLALLCGALGGGAALAAAEALPQGVALVPVGLAGAAAFGAYLAAVSRRPPTPAGVRAVLAGLRSPPASD
jgi:O-antigen/teichoic acid export membrane protein